jgi:type I restriction enzyme M protein
LPLGHLIHLVTNIKVGDAESRAKDVLGRVYECFLSRFAGAEGKKGGEFYEPCCVVRLLVAMIEPYKGCVYDSCCGLSQIPADNQSRRTKAAAGMRSLQRLCFA